MLMWALIGKEQLSEQKRMISSMKLIPVKTTVERASCRSATSCEKLILRAIGMRAVGDVTKS